MTAPEHIFPTGQPQSEAPCADPRPVAAIGIFESKYIHSSLAPWCLAAGIRQWAPQLRAAVCESTVNRPVEELAQKLIALQPAVIGICCYIWNMPQVEALLPLLKTALPQTPIVLGGPEVSWRTAQALETLPQADYVISGEGEEPFARLCAALANGEQPADIPGVCSRMRPDAPPHLPCGEWPSPYCDEYFSALDGRIAYLETSRGCPFSCAFCLSGRCGSVRFLPLERAKAELLALANSDTQTVKLVDRTFNCDRRRADELWRFIADEYGKRIPTGVRFHFEIGGDLLDEENLAVLAAMPKGSIQLEIGLQSFFEPTLEAIRRKTDTERLCRNIRTLLAAGNIHVHIDLIAGLPLETPQQFAESFDTAYALGAHQLQLGFLKLLHGAALRETASENGFLYTDAPPYEITATRWYDAAALERLHRTEDALERLYNSGRFALTLEYLLRITGLRPYALFDGVGEALHGTDTQSLSLDAYTAAVYGYFCTLPGVDAAALRDVMVCDRLATNRTGRLPTCLQVQDPAGLKAAAKTLPPAPANTRRGLAVLYTQNRIVWADYTDAACDPITGRWMLRDMPFTQGETP